jgi:eukaryotic-like serine/threonine-protein kinase
VVNREREIFNAALERSNTAERCAFLDAACTGEPEARLRIEALLGASKLAGDFLPETEAPIHEGPGARIGRYTLIERIGEGGFGVVYLAEQEEPVRRRVALKIIKLGMDTRAFVARFEAERQALAMMEHPNIARVLDGGATATGRPYFVMEVVPGSPITVFCRERRLPLRARLELFMQVCRAVHHAHQKGIIHRDLKPSNILITLDDDRPLAKVIDFGIAKATQDRLTEKTLVTRHHAFIGTPDYMSPEQVGLGDRDVDTRSDIYSLGALLYELLTDRTPFDTRALTALGYAEVQRAILHVEPVTPSQRVTIFAPEERAAAAANRQVNPARLASDLRGDLDRIVLKCLEKDRVRRYETTNALALDLTRYLRNEPVLARAPTLGYRATKFVHRHTRRVIAAAAALILLTAFAVYHAARLATERDRARSEADKAAKVSQLLTEVLSFSDPFRTSGSSEPTVRGLLDAGAERVQKELAAHPELRAEVLTVIGRVYVRLGLHDKAEPVLLDALAAARAMGRPDQRLAQTLNDLGVLQRQRGDHDAAARMLEQALALRRDLIGKPHNDIAITLVELGRVYSALDQLDRAEPLFREALTMRQQVLGPEHREVAVSVGDLALLSWQRGNFATAEALFHQSLALHRKALGPEHPNVAAGMANLALLLFDRNEYTAAETLVREALAMSERTFGQRDWRSARMMRQLGALLHARGQSAEAAKVLEEALEIARAGIGRDHLVVAALEVDRARVYLSAGLADEAETLLRHALEVQRRTYPEKGWRIATTKSLLGAALLQLGRTSDAETLLLEAHMVLRNTSRPQNREADATRQLLGSLYEGTGKFEQAILYRTAANK